MGLPLEPLLKRRVSCSDVVRCAFDLSEQEVRVYDALTDLGAARVEDIAASVRREGSVAYRHLQKLIACGVVEKRKESIEAGGYRFVYVALPRAQMRKKLSACVDDWHAQMRAAIARI